MLNTHAKVLFSIGLVIIIASFAIMFSSKKNNNDVGGFGFGFWGQSSTVSSAIFVVWRSDIVGEFDIWGSPYYLEAPALSSLLRRNNQLFNLEIYYPENMQLNSSRRIDLSISLHPDATKTMAFAPRIDKVDSPLLATYETELYVPAVIYTTLSSFTFTIEEIFPARQKFPARGDLTLWSWVITAPSSEASGILTFKIYAAHSEVLSENEAPLWIITLPITVFAPPPSPTPPPTPSPTPTSASTPTPVPTPSPTPTFIETTTNNISNNITTLLVPIIVAIIGAIAFLGRKLFWPWMEKRIKPTAAQDINDLTADAAIKRIKKSDDVKQLNAWLYDERSSKQRKTIIDALESRIKDLDKSD